MNSRLHRLKHPHHRRPKKPSPCQCRRLRPRRRRLRPLQRRRQLPRRQPVRRLRRRRRPRQLSQRLQLCQLPLPQLRLQRRR
uniref:Uncharacterized protein n=1 Tax=Pararge aegeria TaxID=116150 RepID=S4NSL5_9NEOP